MEVRDLVNTYQTWYKDLFTIDKEWILEIRNSTKTFYKRSVNKALKDNDYLTDLKHMKVVWFETENKKFIIAVQGVRPNKIYAD